MRIITEKRLREFAAEHPTTASAIERWIKLVNRATWDNIQQIRRVFPQADAVTVRSGKVTVIFNVAGNECRVVTAIHYNRGVAFVLRVLTHAEYGKNAWKEQL